MAQQPPRLSFQALQVLRVFLNRPKEGVSGADISRLTDIGSGTLYPLLARLEGAQWLKSNWEDIDPSKAGRPRKKLYRLTHMGIGLSKNAMRTIGA